MFRDSIPGLDKIFKTDIEPPKVILVTGPPGSMKTSFCYTLMSNYLEKRGEFGLYVTLEETVESHLRNMESLGVKLSLHMQVLDLTEIRELDMVISEGESTDYVELLEKALRHFKKAKGDKFTVFALDSLGALYSLMEDHKGMRKKMFAFFKMLRDLNLISFIIMERSLNGEAHLLGNEGFLADGIIVLGLDRSRGKLVRYIQVEKMRACEHSMEKYAIEVRPGGIAVLGPLFE